MYCSAESCTLQRWNFKSHRYTGLIAPWDQLHPKPEYLSGSFRADQQVHLPTKKAKKSVNTQSSKCKQKVAGLPPKQILRLLHHSQVFCETDELWAEIHQQSLQPLVATRIFLLKKRAGALTPRLVATKQHLKPNFHTRKQWNIEQQDESVTNHCFETESVPFQPLSLHEPIRAHTPC